MKKVAFDSWWKVKCEIDPFLRQKALEWAKLGDGCSKLFFIMYFFQNFEYSVRKEKGMG